MIDGDNLDTWRDAAIRHAELPAHQIARFKNPWWNPTWRDLVPPREPAITFGWGSRGKRSRPDSVAAVRFVKGGGDSVACSPETPLDFGSGFRSGSASEEGSSSTEKTVAAAEKRRRVADGADMLGIQKAPLVVIVSVAKDNIRRTGKKKTLCELQEEEKKLLEEKNMLQKEMEMRRRSYGVLKAENQRLKGQQRGLHSEWVSVKSAVIGAFSCSQSPRTRFILPDLNEPLSEDLY